MIPKNLETISFWLHCFCWKLLNEIYCLYPFVLSGILNPFSNTEMNKKNWKEMVTLSCFYLYFIFYMQPHYMRYLNDNNWPLLNDISLRCFIRWCYYFKLCNFSKMKLKYYWRWLTQHNRWKMWMDVDSNRNCFCPSS